MDDNVIEAIDLGGAAPNFTVWGMFSQADIIVQIVMYPAAIARPEIDVSDH